MNQKRTNDNLFAQTINSYTSLARYNLGLLSAVAVIFPSTYSFIEPPYSLDWIILVAFISGLSSFVLGCYVIYKGQFDQKVTVRLITERALQSTLLAFATLLLIFLYIGTNAILDRTSSPTIVDLAYDPRSIEPGTVVKFSGSARDQDRDRLSWHWEVIKIEENASGEATVQSDCNNAVDESASEDRLDSSRSSAYWEAEEPGEYMVLAGVSDTSDLCSESSLTISVSAK